MNAFDPWISGAARLVAEVGGAMTGQRLSILIFHRVLAQADPILPEEVDARRFDRLMALVARTFSVHTFGDALALRDAGRLPRRALAITFDDGYADNAEVALPILQRHGLAATFFVATGFLDGGRMFNDTVIDCVRASSRDWLDLSEVGLGTLPMVSVMDRRAAIAALLPKIKYLALDERERFEAVIHRQAGRPALPASPMMGADQVVALHRAGMEIGGHTVHHPILRVLADPEAEAEIGVGRRYLQDLTGAPVDVFAYPNGRPMQDYDDRHVRMVERLGFRGAVSTVAGVATPGSDRYQLPRFTPWDRSPAHWVGRLLWQRLGR